MASEIDYRVTPLAKDSTFGDSTNHKWEYLKKQLSMS